MKDKMKTSQTGLDLIKHFEDCKLTAYQDSVGVWTNGWGNTHNVDPNATISQDQADADLIKNIGDDELLVTHFVTSDINQNQFDALISFAYNCGFHNLQKSTLLVKVNDGDFDGAAQEFHRWDHAGGKVLKGLTLRRQAESDLFLKELDPILSVESIVEPVPVATPVVEPEVVEEVLQESTGEPSWT